MLGHLDVGISVMSAGAVKNIEHIIKIDVDMEMYGRIKQ